MKKLAILLFLLIAALFVAPGIIGFNVQDQYQKFTTEVQNSGLEVVSSDYQRGWFGSQAATEFKITPPPGASRDPITFTMLQDITHGPLSMDGGLALATIDTSFQVGGEDLFPGDANKIAHTKVGLDGSGATVITVPALKLDSKPGRPEVQFSGANGNMAFGANIEKVDLEINMPELWVGGEGEEGIRFTDATLTSSSEAGMYGLFFGDGAIKVKQIDFNSAKNGIAVKIDAVNISGNTKENDKKLVFTATYAVDAVTVSDTAYGPAELTIEFANIPSEVAYKLQQEMRKMRSQKMSQEEASMAMVGMLMGAGPEILKADPKISIKRLFVKTPDGEIDGNLSVAAIGLQMSEINDMQAVLKKLEADAALSIPEKFVLAIMERQAKPTVTQQIEQLKNSDPEAEAPSQEEIDAMVKQMAGQQLEFFLQQEMVKRDGKNISSSAKMSGGLLSVNGKTVPLP